MCTLDMIKILHLVLQYFVNIIELTDQKGKQQLERSAHNLAAAGLNNWNVMHFFSEPFGRLQEKMDLDMGFGPPILQLQISPILIDAQGHVRGFAPPQIVVLQQDPDKASDSQSVIGGTAAMAA